MTRASLALLLGAVAGLLAATQPISDPDVFWHLATGRETLAHGLVRTDVFSWTVRGEPVSIDQWLGQALMYGAYLVGDWRGVAILRVLSVVALVTLVAGYVSLGRPVRPLAMVLAIVPALLLTRAVWVDRPELQGVVLFAAVLVLLGLGRDDPQGRRPARRGVALIAVPVVIGVWANVHGSFAAGVVLAVLVCAEGALHDGARRRVYIACAAASVLASFITPAGLATWSAPGLHLFSPPRDIQEWGVVDVRTPLGAAYVVMVALVIGCVFLGSALEPRELVIIIPVAALSLTALRQAPLLAIAAAPLFAQRASELMHVLSERARTTEAPRGASVTLLTAAVLLVAAVLVAPTQPDEGAYPVAALISIPSGDGVLARYEWGGWLIWRAPATAVLVDGRLTPYVGGVLDDYRRIVAAAPGWRDAIARRGVRTLLVVPTDPVAVRAQELGWRLMARSNGLILIAVP